MGKRWLIGLGVLALIVGMVVVGLRVFDRVRPSEGCEARVGGRTVSLTLEQAENVGLMAAISMQRGMPARAATIAIATSTQESKLYNIEHGDRDSLGLFQQRPSQGWGTAQEILNSYYSINAFYDALARIEGYESMIRVSLRRLRLLKAPEDRERVEEVLAGLERLGFDVNEKRAKAPLQALANDEDGRATLKTLMKQAFTALAT